LASITHSRYQKRGRAAVVGAPALIVATAGVSRRSTGSEVHMSRRKMEQTPPLDASAEEQTPPLDASAEEQTPPRNRRKKDTRKLRITLSLSEDVVRRLRSAANMENMLPCEVVEMLIDGPLRPYVISLRGKRIVSEPGEAA
jgi:hypothetical protein